MSHRIVYDKDVKGNLHYFDTNEEALRYAHSIYKRTGFNASVFRVKSKAFKHYEYVVVEAHSLRPLKKEKKFGLFGA